MIRRLRLVFACVALFFALPLLAQQDTVRVVSYNLLNFPRVAVAERLPAYRMIFREIRPDILVVQELETATGLQQLLNETLNTEGVDYYEAAPFVNGPDSDSGLLYNRDKVDLVAVRSIPTSLRNIMEYELRTGGETYTVYSVHLKAGIDPQDDAQRAAEAGVLRSHLNNRPTGSAFLVVGDFNLQGSRDSAFEVLTGSQADNDGRLFDPMNAIGTWHDNPLFARLHTQSTRTTSFQDGATGGLDDRFDLILVSESLLQPSAPVRVLVQTYTTFGNDGRHFNLAINDGRNFAVADSIADALHFASDHLPVYVDLVIQQTTNIAESGAIPEVFQLSAPYPNPFTPETRVVLTLHRPASGQLVLYDGLGRQVAILWQGRLAAGEHGFPVRMDRLPAGVYLLRAQFGMTRKVVKLVYLR